MKVLRKFRPRWSLTLAIALLSIAAVHGPVFAGRVPFPAAFIYFFPLFSPEWPEGTSPNVPDIGDLITQFYEYRTLSHRAIADGALPKWNPYVLSGTTFVGNPLSALFYPPNAFYYILPVAAAWTIGFLLRTFLGIVFTAMFLRRIGATATGAVVAGLLYIFSGFMTVWQGQSMPETAIWLPLICYSVVRLHVDRSILSTIILAFAFGMPALAGHPETMVHLTIVGALLAVFLAPLRSPISTSRNTVRFLTCFAAAGFLSLGVAAVQLVPSVEWFQNSNRGLDITWPSAPMWSLLGIVSRDIAGTFNSFELLIPNQASYVGMMAFVAVPLALLSDSKRYVLFFLSLSVLSMCGAYGIGPVLDVIHQIPFLSALKHDRLILLMTFGMAVLAGLGISVIEDLSKNPDRRRAFRAVILAAAGLFIAAQLVYTVSLLTLTPPKEMARTGNLKMSLLFLLLSAAVVFAGITVRKAAPWFRLAVLLVVCADVYTFAYGYMPYVSTKKIFPPNELFARLSAEEAPFRIAQLGSSYATNTQMIYGLHETGGYEIPLTRLKKFTEGIDLNHPDAVVLEARLILESKDRRADLLNTKYYVVSQWLPEYPKFLEMRDRFRFMFEHRRTAVFENLNALPPAFLVPAAGIRVIQGADPQVNVLKDPSFNPEASVILDEQPPPVPPSTVPPAPQRRVGMVQRSTNELRMQVEADQESVLVISQTYYPGWKAYVDGQSMPVFPANHALTGTRVGQGSHEVRISYEPDSLKLGQAISLGTLALVAVLLFVRRKREAVFLPDS